MNLQEVVREHTRSTRDLIVGIEGEIDDCRRQQSSTSARERILQEEIGALRIDATKREEDFRSLESESQDLEKQIAALQDRLREQQKERDHAENEWLKRKTDLSEKSKQSKLARQESESWASKADASEDRLAKLRGRIKVERQEALREYYTSLWTRLVESHKFAQGQTGALEAWKSFNDARHRDPHIADLWEQKLEWQRIAKSSGPAAVRDTAHRELARIEEAIDQLFPGALQGARPDRPDELEELFYYPSRGENVNCILICIPEGIRERMDSGGEGESEQLAAKIIWAFARAIPLSPSAELSTCSRFGAVQGTVAMRVSRSGTDLNDLDPITLHLPGGGRVSFMLSELPQELIGAISDENTNE